MKHACFTALLLLAGCSSDGAFASSVLSKVRPATELSGTEAALLCNEAVTYLDASHEGEAAWVAAYCHRVGLEAGTDPSSCEEAERDCLDTIEMPFPYYWSYGSHCGTLESTPVVDCTVTIEDIEGCVSEMRIALRESAALPCSEVTREYSVFTEHMSAGRAVLVQRSSPCSVLLGNGRP